MGFTWSLLTRVDKQVPAELVRFRRKEQMSRLRKFLTHDLLSLLKWQAQISLGRAIRSSAQASFSPTGRASKKN
jgi:hypothetical protein